MANGFFCCVKQKTTIYVDNCLEEEDLLILYIFVKNFNLECPAYFIF